MDFVLALFRIGSGVLLWALHFGLIYGLTALACARDAAARVPSLIAALTLVAASLAVLVIAHEWKRRQRFDAWLTAALAALALVAIVFQALPAGLLMPCA